MGQGDRKKGCSRRDFLKMSGLLGLSAAAATALPVSEAVAFGRGLNKVTRSIKVMGTFAVITVVDPSKSRADDAIGKAFDEMRRLTKIMDRFDSASAVSTLNRDGRLGGAPPELCEVVGASGRYHKLSGGAFDITVAPLVDLYRNVFYQTGRPPDSDMLSRAMALVDGGGVAVSGRSVSLPRPGMAVTLDGIAKGYIIDAAARVLKACGVAHALVNSGGDIRAAGGREPGSAWTIAVRDPDSTSFADTIHLTDGAVATSGDYEVYFDRERLYNHIINPTTGASPVISDSVSVAAPTVTRADALATTVFVMGPDRGRALIESLPDARCFILTRAGERVASKGWAELRKG